MKQNAVNQNKYLSYEARWWLGEDLYFLATGPGHLAVIEEAVNSSRVVLL